MFNIGSINTEPTGLPSGSCEFYKEYKIEVFDKVSGAIISNFSEWL